MKQNTNRPCQNVKLFIITARHSFTCTVFVADILLPYHVETYTHCL